MINWQAIVGDPGETGAAGEKGRPVSVSFDLQGYTEGFKVN